MNFDIKSVPFSRYGSRFAVSRLSGSKDGPPGLYLRSVYGGAGRPIFAIELGAGGQRVNFEEIATPSSLVLRPDVPDAGKKNPPFVEICIPQPDVVRIRGRGVGLRLSRDPSPGGLAISAPQGQWRILPGIDAQQFMLTPIVGHLHVDAPWQLVEAWGNRHHRCPRIVASFLPDVRTGLFECAIQRYESEPLSADFSRPFDECVKAAGKEFAAWAAKTPAVGRKHAAAGELAAYVTWSAVVEADGNFHRPVMLMSKNMMTKVWNWDNYFNAWADSYRNFDFAWGQFMFFLDHQHDSGELADMIDEHRITFDFTKPPVHGWMLRRIMERTGRLTKSHLKAVYEPLCRATEWWFKCRDDDGDGVPQYNHGNDSGWDNSTSFDVGVPLESPDLSAFLIVQMDVLADVARKLGKARHAAAWKKRADELLAKLLAHSWRGDRFVAPRSGDHAVTADGDSLLPFETIVLGKRLPAEVRKHMVAGLADNGRFLTPLGLATESLRSSQYLPKGYWRGPIWAPSTMIIVDGLMDAGEKTLARDIAGRFCQMCLKSGFAENFDAVTGAGLCDPAYTWTASVFMILAHEYVK